jgi:hypothetical protein
VLYLILRVAGYSFVLRLEAPCHSRNIINDDRPNESVSGGNAYLSTTGHRHSGWAAAADPARADVVAQENQRTRINSPARANERAADLAPHRRVATGREHGRPIAGAVAGLAAASHAYHHHHTEPA